jgi:hypothetical protein
MFIWESSSLLSHDLSVVLVLRREWHPSGATATHGPTTAPQPSASNPLAASSDGHWESSDRSPRITRATCRFTEKKGVIESGLALDCQQAAKRLLRVEEREGECGLRLDRLFGWAKRAELLKKSRKEKERVFIFWITQNLPYTTKNTMHQHECNKGAPMPYI